MGGGGGGEVDGTQNRDEVSVTRAGSPTLMNLSATALILGNHV